ncbi:hypothetical protein GCM10028856_38760 [Halopiger thermotolerans]
MRIAVPDRQRSDFRTCSYSRLTRPRAPSNADRVGGEIRTVGSELSCAYALECDRAGIIRFDRVYEDGMTGRPPPA